MEIGRREALLGAGCSLVCAPLLGRTTTPGRSHITWTTVQALLDRYVADRRYAGVAAALSYGGGPTSFLSAGTLAYDSDSPVTAESLFRIYSLTKPVTGIAAMALVEDGLIALDQPVGEVLPQLGQMMVAINPSQSLEARPATRAMTMRHLITHTSGMSNWQPFLGDNPISIAYRSRGLTPGSYGRRRQLPGRAPQVQGLEALVRGVATVPLIAEPGTAWNYSIGFDVMGAVVERVTGKGFDLFLKERLFAPMGMESTGFQVTSDDLSRMSTLYEMTPDGPAVVDAGPTSAWLQPSTLLAGGGGLVSSPRDFIRFLAMLLSGGKSGDNRILRRETVALALSNLLPAGVAYPPTGWFGAGASVVMPGIVSENGPAGTYSALGSSSTLLTLDPARKGMHLFFAQLMPNSGPAAAIYKREFNTAVNADLQRA